MELYFQSSFYMLILFFSGSLASIVVFEAVVTSAAVLAKGFSNCRALDKIKLH